MPSPVSPSPSSSSPPRVAGLAPGHPWQLGLGLVAWSAWFVIVYGGLSVGCAIAEPAPEHRQFNAINGVLLLVTLALVLWLARASRTCARAARDSAGTRAGPAAAGAASPGGVPDDDATARFIAHAAAWLHAIAAVAAVFVGAPMLALWPCI